jgi:UDP-N-acetylmuramoyl-tripeptide--D-alanyl-D-alanine ligase
VRGGDLESKGLEGISFMLEYGGESLRVRTRLPGRHLLPNALAAAAVALVEGMTLDEVAQALAVARIPLRLHVYRGRNDSTILDDTYNASPASMLAALELLADLPGRRIAVLGDMRELGSEEREGHRIVGREAARVAQVIYAVGELGYLIGEEAKRAGHPAVSLWPSKEEAARQLVSELQVGDVVLLKASRAMALETMLPELKG